MRYNPSQPRDLSGKWSKGKAGRKRKGAKKGRYNQTHRHGVLRKKFGGRGYGTTQRARRKARKK